MNSTDENIQRESAKTSSMHAPNPNQEEAFPLLVLDVRNGVSNPSRLGFKKMHWHDDLQFIVVTAGSAAIDCAGRHFNCAKGQGALFNSNVPHRIISDVGTEYMSFIFPEKLLGFFLGSEMMAFGVSPFVGAHAQPTMHFNLAAPWHLKVLDELDCARDLLINKEATGIERYRACAHLLSAWSIYILNVEQRIPTRAERAADERMKAFTLFIDGNYGRDISLEDIAKAGNVSKAECARCFKRLIQTTPYAYLLNYRISKATELMHEGELNATAIARTVGFGSSSHFSTAFKNALGMTPKEYMNEVRKQSGGGQLHVR